MLRQTVELTTMFAEALPVLIGSWRRGCRSRRSRWATSATASTGSSESMPPAARSASRILVTTRLLLALVALMVALHAAYLLVGLRLGPAYSG